MKKLTKCPKYLCVCCRNGRMNSQETKRPTEDFPKRTRYFIKRPRYVPKRQTDKPTDEPTDEPTKDFPRMLPATKLFSEATKPITQEMIHYKENENKL